MSAHVLPGRYAALVAIVSVALVLRLAFAATRDRPLFSDEIDYDGLARTLAATGSYSQDGKPTAYRTVGYPAFVAGIYASAGPKPGHVHLVQAALDAASCGLLFAIAGGGTVGLWAAGIWAVYPSAVLYTDLLMPETLFVFGLLAAVLAWRRGGSSGKSARSAIAVGALLGALALIKPQAVLLLVALPLAALGLGLRGTRWGLILATASLVLLPWVVRNAVRLGRPTLVTSVGSNLLIGNNPFATGGYSPNVPPDMRPTASEETLAEDQAIGEATLYISHDPGQFLRHGIRSLAHLAATEGGMVVWGFHPAPGPSKARLRQKIREVPLRDHLAISGGYALVLLTGMLGLLAAPKSDLKAAFLALLGVWIAVHFVFYGGSRYHFPLMPLFALFAAQVMARATSGAEAAPGRLTRRAWVGYLLFTAGLLGVWAGEYWVVFRG